MTKRKKARNGTPNDTSKETDVVETEGALPEQSADAAAHGSDETAELEAVERNEHADEVAEAGADERNEREGLERDEQEAARSHEVAHAPTDEGTAEAAAPAAHEGEHDASATTTEEAAVDDARASRKGKKAKRTTREASPEIADRADEGSAGRGDAFPSIPPPAHDTTPPEVNDVELAELAARAHLAHDQDEAHDASGASAHDTSRPPEATPNVGEAEGPEAEVHDTAPPTIDLRDTIPPPRQPRGSNDGKRKKKGRTEEPIQENGDADAPPAVDVAEGVDNDQAAGTGFEEIAELLEDAEATVNLGGNPLPGRDDLDAPTVSVSGEVDEALAQHKHLRGLLEALVFASDAPIKPADLAKHAQAPVKQVRELLDELRAEYAPRGIQLDEIAGGWVFRTSVRYAPFVRDLTKQKPVRLSRAQVETLAIIAYRQPITRPEIDDVRGVDSGPVLKVLLERDLVRILGKREEAGRPLIYGTTNNFLEFFGLRSLKDLPTLREFTELTEESREAYEAEMGEAPDARTPVQVDRASEPILGAEETPEAPVDSEGDELAANAIDDALAAATADLDEEPMSAELAELERALASDEDDEFSGLEDAEESSSDAESEEIDGSGELPSDDA